MAHCKLSDCTVAKDGRCLEGRTDDCPNLLPETFPGKSDAVSLDFIDTSDSTVALYPPSEALYSGFPLEIAEAREFSVRGRAIVVSLAGMTESGKTSLIARLHQQFQTGPVGGYDFAGSRTLPRFEELNWLATIESGVGAPTMEHSSRHYDNSFLHFTVRQRINGANPVDVLINDISGETFPEAIITERVCEELVCLRRADHLGLVVDGAAVAQRHLRHDHCAKAKNFVQRVLQTGQIGKHTVLHLIVTKLDVLLSGEHQAESLEATARLEAEFGSQFSNSVAKIYYWRLAARPVDGSMPTVEVTAELFATWAGSTYRYSKGVVRTSQPTGLTRDFCRFAAVLPAK